MPDVSNACVSKRKSAGRFSATQNFQPTPRVKTIVLVLNPRASSASRQRDVRAKRRGTRCALALPRPAVECNAWLRSLRLLALHRVLGGLLGLLFLRGQLGFLSLLGLLLTFGHEGISVVLRERNSNRTGSQGNASTSSSQARAKTHSDSLPNQARHGRDPSRIGFRTHTRVRTTLRGASLQRPSF